MSSVKHVAVVGAGGNIGAVLADELLKSGKYTVSALTRASSTSKIAPGINVIKTEYDHASLVKSLAGQDALIISMSVMAPPDTQLKLIDAAMEAGVKYIMPSEWGSDPVGMEKISREIHMYDSMTAVRNHLKEKNANWIAVACSFWYQFSLAGTEARYGFNFDKKRVTLFGDGSVKINTTSWPQVGRAVVEVLSEPEKWNRQSVYINSFHVSQNDMLEAVEKVTGDQWVITHEDTKERYQRGCQMMYGGNMEGFGIAMYTRGFFPEDPLSFEVKNEELGLPKEDFLEGTKAAVEMARSGRTNALA